MNTVLHWCVLQINIFDAQQFCKSHMLMYKIWVTRAWTQAWVTGGSNLLHVSQLLPSLASHLGTLWHHYLSSKASHLLHSLPSFILISFPFSARITSSTRSSESYHMAYSISRPSFIRGPEGPSSISNPTPRPSGTELENNYKEG